MAATIAQSRPDRANFLLSLFYAGPGLGILASGLIAPFLLQGFGPGSWWIAWWAMTLLSLVLIMPLLLPVAKILPSGEKANDSVVA